ncbi:Os02g0235701, partial [Oryza sativa Japonica Group]
PGTTSWHPPWSPGAGSQRETCTSDDGQHGSQHAQAQHRSPFHRYLVTGPLLDAKINVLLDTEAEASGVTEVPPEQLVLLDLEPALQQLHRLLPSHRHVARDLLVTPDSERPHGVPRCKESAPRKLSGVGDLGGAG